MPKTMKELIPITEQNGKRAVSARELHAFLESKQEFTNWILFQIFMRNYSSVDHFIELHKSPPARGTKDRNQLVFNGCDFSLLVFLDHPYTWN